MQQQRCSSSKAAPGPGRPCCRPAGLCVTHSVPLPFPPFPCTAPAAPPGAPPRLTPPPVEPCALAAPAGCAVLTQSVTQTWRCATLRAARTDSVCPPDRVDRVALSIIVWCGDTVFQCASVVCVQDGAALLQIHLFLCGRGAQPSQVRCVVCPSSALQGSLLVV